MGSSGKSENRFLAIANPKVILPTPLFSKRPIKADPFSMRAKYRRGYFFCRKIFPGLENKFKRIEF